MPLTQTNFETTVFDGGAKNWFIKFYAPWCGHCKKLAPTWTEFAIKHSDIVNVGEVDCTVEESLCDYYNIKGFPTLLLFLSDDPLDYLTYKDDRKVENFYKFANDNL